MVRIDRSTMPVPDILTTQGASLRAIVETNYDNGTRDFPSASFDNTIYGNSTVKAALRESQSGKCCFCESHVAHISHGDVEHFRPKGGWNQNTSDPLHKPGYYWLAYDWSNLLYSCQICNQTYKKNLFPLIDPTQRALSHHDNIDLEQPLLIQPVKENPEDHIGFHQHIAFHKSVRGEKTIEVCGINRPELNQARKEIFSTIPTLIHLIEISATIHNSEITNLANQAKQNLRDLQDSSSEFSSMIKCAIEASGLSL